MDRAATPTTGTTSPANSDTSSASSPSTSADTATSSHTREGYAVTAFAADLAAFAEAIGIVPCDYVGASLGARNAIPYAGDNPTHLKHLVWLGLRPGDERSLRTQPDWRHEPSSRSAGAASTSTSR